MASALRGRLLSLYRRCLRLGKTWEARDPLETPTERAYILEESKKLFRLNSGVESAERVEAHVREAEARITMAEHYRYGV